MAKSRKVRCNECGHEWDCSAKYPQCSDPNDVCGRSRDITVLEEPDPDAGESREPEPEPAQSESPAEGDSRARAPFFSGENVEADPERDMSLGDGPEITPAESSDSDGQDDSEELPDLDAYDIELFIKTPFDMLARQRGDHWALTDGEQKQLGEAWSRVANKYAPAIMAEHMVEAMAVVTTISVVAPRLQEDKQRREQHAPEQPEPEEEMPPEATPDNSLSASQNSGGLAISNV